MEWRGKGEGGEGRVVEYTNVMLYALPQIPPL